MWWLNNGVLVQEGDAERAEIDEERDVFEEEFERGIEEQCIQEQADAGD